MGGGPSCNRWDCSATVEDCTNGLSPRRSYVFFCDSAFQQPDGGQGSRGSRGSAEEVASQDLDVGLVTDRFGVRHLPGHGEWRRRYLLGRELGAGQTAAVFEAFVAAPEFEELGQLPQFMNACADGASKSSTDGAAAAAQRRAAARTGRKVALKRFHTSGTSMFQHELKAFLASGVHPNILRLLESFENDADEDVLVLEYCDGGDVYDLYAANNGCCMLEAYVIQLVRQLLQALHHLSQRGIEHRDVKPENLLLYGAASGRSQVPQLKLADFGWACVASPGVAAPAVPPEGVGSLWYAPPEMNPPVAGMQHPQPGELGLGDMWSVGVITYLLLVGHSPFNSALRISDPAAREVEVIRLAALGQTNTATRPWPRLSAEARSFISALIQPHAALRLTSAKAWEHPWISRWQDGYADSMGQQRVRLSPSQADQAVRSSRWQGLDGFQRLCWLALARAVAEPELMEVSALQGFVSEQSFGSGTNYTEELAIELLTHACPAWFTPEAAWYDVLRLAFLYLDADADGLLSAPDLSRHVVGEAVGVNVQAWLHQWSRGPEPWRLYASRGLSFSDFCWALSSSDKRSQAAGEAHEGDAERLREQPACQDVSGDKVFQKRMHAIDEVCQRFLDEEFDDHGFGI